MVLFLGGFKVMAEMYADRTKSKVIGYDHIICRHTNPESKVRTHEILIALRAIFKKRRK